MNTKYPVIDHAVIAVECLNTKIWEDRECSGKDCDSVCVSSLLLMFTIPLSLLPLGKRSL